jgi:hypothetical protein
VGSLGSVGATGSYPGNWGVHGCLAVWKFSGLGPDLRSLGISGVIVIYGHLSM